MRSILFSKARINGLVLKNRFMRSATYEALADVRGCATNDLTKLYTDYADKDIGLIMSSCTQVDSKSQHHPTMLSLVTDEARRSMGVLVKAVHAHDAPLGVQLCHSGAGSKPVLTGCPPETPDNLTRAGIERIVDNFVAAAKSCADVGADAVQIHASGPYLLSTFLSPKSNKRTDEFGGNQEKRTEIVRRIVHGVRKSVPVSFPVLVKLNSAGVKPDELGETAKILEAEGVDLVEVTLGVGNPKKPGHKSGGEVVRKAVKLPLMVCGGFLTLDEMEKAVSSGYTDFVALSRPLIRQPDLVHMFKNGATDKGTCKGCNACFKWTSQDEKPLECAFGKK